MNSAVPYLPNCPWKKKWEGVVNFKVNLWNQALVSFASWLLSVVLKSP